VSDNPQVGDPAVAGDAADEPDEIFDAGLYDAIDAAIEKARAAGARTLPPIRGEIRPKSILKPVRRDNKAAAATSGHPLSARQAMDVYFAYEKAVGRVRELEIQVEALRMLQGPLADYCAVLGGDLEAFTKAALGGDLETFAKSARDMLDDEKARWHHDERARAEASLTHQLQTTLERCRDLAARLDRIEGQGPAAAELRATASTAERAFLERAQPLPGQKLNAVR